MTKNIFKSIGAVLGGILINVILASLTDYILEAVGIFPPASGGLFVTWMLVVALVYRTLYALVGGYVTARLAPSNPPKHIYWLMGIGGFMGIVGAIAGWNLSDHWYPIILVITSVAATYFGGKFFVEKSK